MEGIINGTREVFKSAMIISTGVLIIIMFGFALVAIGPEFVTIERDTAPEALVAAVPESLNAGARARASEDLLRVPPDLLAEFLPDHSTEDTIINNSWTNVMWTVTVVAVGICVAFGLLWLLTMLPTRLKSLRN